MPQKKEIVFSPKIEGMSQFHKNIMGKAAKTEPMITIPTTNTAPARNSFKTTLLILQIILVHLSLPPLPVLRSRNPSNAIARYIGYFDRKKKNTGEKYYFDHSTLKSTYLHCPNEHKHRKAPQTKRLTNRSLHKSSPRIKTFDRCYYLARKYFRRRSKKRSHNQQKQKWTRTSNKDSDIPKILKTWRYSFVLFCS